MPHPTHPSTGTHPFPREGDVRVRDGSDLCQSVGCLHLAHVCALQGQGNQRLQEKARSLVRHRPPEASLPIPPLQPLSASAVQASLEHHRKRLHPESQGPSPAARHTSRSSLSTYTLRRPSTLLSLGQINTLTLYSLTSVRPDHSSSHLLSSD